MNTLHVNRYALGIVAIVILAGCGSQVPAIGMTGAGFASPAHGKSWMLPEAKSEDLIYVSDGYTVSVLKYPQGKLVGAITNLEFPGGMCSNTKGDVFITLGRDREIVEYTHGGTSSMATLQDDEYEPNGCAVDGASGNLAVANFQGFYTSAGNVAIYQNAQGTPTFYSAPNIENFNFCTYDTSGNLFADGSDKGPMGLAEMGKGSGAFSAITLSDESLFNPGNLQWDGKYLALASSQTPKGPLPVNRVQVAGSIGTIVGKTNLRTSTKRNRNSYQPVQYWIQGHVILGQNGLNGHGLGLWRYPSGGKPIEVLKPPSDVLGVTVSLAQSPSHRK
jgi:hypothetical protein